MKRPLAQIPIPAAKRLQAFRTRVVPALVFGATIATMVLVWQGSLGSTGDGERTNAAIQPSKASELWAARSHEEAAENHFGAEWNEKSVPVTEGQGFPEPAEGSF